jgi:hypothetical protein
MKPTFGVVVDVVVDVGDDDGIGCVDGIVETASGGLWWRASK